MRQPTPEKHSAPVLIIKTLLALVGMMSLYALDAFLPIERYFGADLFMLSLFLVTLVTDFIIHRPACRNPVVADYKRTLTDFRYMRFAIAAGAAFSGTFVFIANGGFVFINQLKLPGAAFASMLAIAIGSYWLSAVMGIQLTKNMSRSQSSMLASSLMLMGAVTCVGSSFLTNGQSIPGYLIGIILYTLGAGFFIPLCQIRAIEQMTETPDKAANLIFSIIMLIATLAISLLGLLPAAGTLPLSVFTLLATAITTLCQLGVDRERDPARRSLFWQRPTL